MRTRQKPLSPRRRSLAGLGLWLLSAAALADPANPLTGFYYGTATITRPAHLGNVDLAFYLDVTGSAIQPETSYIDLDKTLLFPAIDPPVAGRAVGPRVSGNFRAGIFKLISQPFPGTAGGKDVTRSIRLTNAKVGNGGTTITGQYLEQVKGMTPTPMLIRGQFRLIRPAATVVASGQDADADGCLELNEIRAGGADPNAVEFSDVSAAMNLYRNPGKKLKVGKGPGPNCKNGAETMQNALKAYQDSPR